MLKKSYKWLAVVLALSVLFSCLPMSVFALELSNDDSDVIIEDESLREESVKHFKMPDGSYTAVVYTAPVHRKDADGVWQDIDNRMDESTVKNKQAYVTSDGRTVFSKKISSKDATVFELSENGYSIKVSFANDGIKNTTAKLSNHAEKYKPTGADDIETQYKKLKTIDNNTTIAYRNLLKGMTLEYVLSGNDIKENIIVRKPSDSYVYSFIYELEGLTAALNENGSIDLFDENSGDFVCEIPAPYMYDDDGAVSYDVSYALEDLGDGAYKLTVSADEEWIESDDRAFPVVIDPTMTFDIDYKDTYITSYHPDSNYGGSDKLWVSSAETSFVHFTNLPRLVNYATVESATLNLRYYYYISTGSLTVGAYQVTENWNEYSLTWNTAQEMLFDGILPLCIGTAILPASSSFKSPSTPGVAAINVTELVQAWFAGVPNYGMAIKREGGTNASVILNSKETYTGAYYEIGYTTNRTTYSPVDNGVYFFQNKQVDGFVQIDNNATSTNVEGAILELHEFDGASDQKWRLTYLRNGYYKITSVASGKAITAPSATNNSITQESYQADTNQMWRVTIEDDGLYQLSPKSNLSYRMAAGEGIGANGRNVEMRAVQSDNQDEWKLTYLGNSYDVLQVVYGFSSEQAALINTLYEKVDEKFPNETELQRAWKCARLLGGLVYGRNPDDQTYNESNGILVSTINSTIDQIKFYAWKDVAGQVFNSSEENYFVNTLGYTKTQYNQLKDAVTLQHNNANDSRYSSYSDFAHAQIALATRLAYKLKKDGIVSNIGTFCSDEEISYLAGWLGDATLSVGYGSPKMSNPDYCADLDSENIYRYMIAMECSYCEATSYYFFSFSNSANRATIFLNNIEYNVVCQKVFKRLDLDEGKGEDWEELRMSYPDTYNFLKSLEYKLETIGDY